MTAIGLADSSLAVGKRPEQPSPVPGAESETRLSEVLGALSYALDITEGQPVGHSARSCMIGMRIAAQIGLGHEQRSALFYALLMKDAGCSSNAARISALFAADDQDVKRDRKLTYWPGARASLGHVTRTAGADSGVLERARRVIAVSRSGAEGARALTETRCERGADIALMLALPEEAAEAIRSLDEHWDGGGYPAALEGEEIPVLARIMGLAQTAEVFFCSYGQDTAHTMARERRGTWFDPQLVDALDAVRSDRPFWRALTTEDPLARVATFEPWQRTLFAGTESLDRVAEAFARVVDAKSPYTYRHSRRVAEIAVAIGGALDLTPDELRKLARAGLLHDIGKLGISNRILDKPGKLTEAEWVAVRRHPKLTFEVLRRVIAFRDVAKVAAAHHERLDGSGYHRGVTGEELDRPARVLAVADVCEALSAERPYRDALSPDEVKAIMARDVGTKLDRDCYEAVEAVLDEEVEAVTGEEPSLWSRLAAT